MKIVKNEGFNNYSLEGLTLGKLLAIQHSLYLLQEKELLTPVGNDVYIFLRNQHLEDWE